MMLLCSLEQQPKKPPLLLAQVYEDKVRRESKAHSEETLKHYLQFSGEGGVDWEQRLSKSLGEAALSYFSADGFCRF